MKLIFDINSLVRVESSGAKFKTGSEMSDIAEIKNGAILFDETIHFVGNSQDAREFIKQKNIIIDEEISAEGKTLMPGFVDSHTHIVFAGNRSKEFGKRLRGVTYKEIAEEGGGIQTTVKATNSASVGQLTENGRKLALSAIKHGTTTIEVKSGYSLRSEGEMNQLYAIRNLAKELPINVVPTFLGAHDFPLEYKNNHNKYIDIIINEMIPKVKSEDLAEYCDAFIDEGYYSPSEGKRVLQAGLDAGMKIKVHCDELVNTESARMVSEMGAVSADHLLQISDEGIEALVGSGTVAGLLPGTAYFIRMDYAPARKLINRGAIVCLATDCNPGSSFTENMQTILSLSVINMGMTAEEAITAATLNAAHSLGRSGKIGSIEVGKRSDFILLDCPNYTDLFYHFGINHVEQTWASGNKIFDKRISLP
jgi:imidazolonepropionase